MLGVLSDKVREGQMIIIEDLLLENGKTKEMFQILEALRSVSPVLLVADGVEPSVLRASRNIPRLKKLPVSLLSVVDLLNVKTLVITLEAVRRAGKGASAGTVYRIVLYDTYDQSRRKALRYGESRFR